MPELVSAARRLGRSFGFALAGIAALARTQPNFRIHLLAAALVVVAGLLLALPAPDMALLLLAITLVLAMEAINTAFEALADAVSPAYHPLVKRAKDIAAGGVLLTSLGAVGIGLILFLPRLALPPR